MLRSMHERPAVLFGSVFIAFLALSWIVAVAPAFEAQRGSRALANSTSLTAEQQRGLQVYVSEGCPACHTQQVRPLRVAGWTGRASVTQDYARLKPAAWWQGTPGILGSERTGPDLSNIGQRQPSSDWQLIHLYNPRSVSPWSVMPAFPWLFEVVSQPPTNARVVTLPPAFAPPQGKAVATQRALDLVAYLTSLRQTPLTGVGAPPSPSGASDGARQYAANCAACHQATGEGVTATFPPLKGDVAVNDSDPTRHIATVLYGLHGKQIGQIVYPVTMPPFGPTLSDEQVAAIVNFERSSWGNHGAPITPAQVRQVRSAGVQP